MDVARVCWKTWKMLEDDPKLALVLIIIICFICILLFGMFYYLFLIVCECRYITSGHRQTKSECIQCQLINMGEMACNTGVCPGCGRVPLSVMASSSEMIQY